jgi:NADH-quinone oxidoreductase subunit F
MPLTEPVLTKRIPTFPWGDPKNRRTVGIDQFMATGGYETLRKAIAMQPGEVVNLVKDANLRGRGGAGFPAGLKWTFLPPPDGKIRYLCINCDEAEPGTFKDRLLVDFDPHQILEGIAIACYACQLDTAFFFIRGEYHHQAKVMQRAIDEAYAKGVFGSKGLLNGASPFKVECYLHRGAGAYICGEETGAPRGRSRVSAAGRAQAAVPGGQGPVRRADDHQQRRDARGRRPDRRQGRGVVEELRLRVERRRPAELRPEADGCLRPRAAPRRLRVRPRHPAAEAR